MRRITTALFVYQEVVSRHNKFFKIDFSLSLVVYQRKISTLIEEQNVMAYAASIKDLIQLKSAFENIISNSLLIIQAKPVKSKITTF